ncbi:GNAT family N-acetyltransferase [Bacillus sp. FSL K6-3431]|uniref:GNAT family N-acetyltransferase n=1 Tax=Bacillus sp. FSL K6-3431 TaxID=2921500 RepID=UPI0030F9C7A7
MNISIRDVTNEIVPDILSLSVDETQTTFIETTEQCLKEAKECAIYKPVGLYSDNNLVGFAMYGFFSDESKNGRIWLDRFLIDKKYQGCGLGTILLKELIDKITEEFSCQKLYLSIVGNNKRALHLYEKFDFHLNGESDVNDEKIMVKTISVSK